MSASRTALKGLPGFNNSRAGRVHAQRTPQSRPSNLSKGLAGVESALRNASRFGRDMPNIELETMSRADRAGSAELTQRVTLSDRGGRCETGFAKVFSTRGLVGLCILPCFSLKPGALAGFGAASHARSFRCRSSAADVPDALPPPPASCRTHAGAVASAGRAGRIHCYDRDRLPSR